MDDNKFIEGLMKCCDNNRLEIENLFNRLIERSNTARSMYYRLDFIPKYLKRNHYEWIGVELTEVQRLLDELKEKFS